MVCEKAQGSPRRFDLLMIFRWIFIVSPRNGIYQSLIREVGSMNPDRWLVQTPENKSPVRILDGPVSLSGLRVCCLDGD